jgi:protein-S-isoprenylcysteine O-methyltransferase Ste14
MNPARLRSLHFAGRGWVLALLLAALVFARARSQAALQPGWLILLAAGLAWRAWAGFHIAGHSNGAALAGPELAAGGPYRISRHPLYFANLLCAAGLVLYAHCLPAWAAFAILALAAAHHEALGRGEERFLLASRGDAYLRYMQVTPRWPGFRRTGGGAAGAGPGGGGPPAGAPDPSIAGWRKALARQGWNLAKGCACALLIRIAAAAAG